MRNKRIEKCKSGRRAKLPKIVNGTHKPTNIFLYL
jgi:hypothetical protein